MPTHTLRGANLDSPNRGAILTSPGAGYGGQLRRIGPGIDAPSRHPGLSAQNRSARTIHSSMSLSTQNWSE